MDSIYCTSSIEFRRFNEQLEERDYFVACGLYEQHQFLSEGFIAKYTKGVQEKLKFIKTFAEQSNQKLEDLVKVFKNKKVFAFFKSIKFSISKLFAQVKKGYQVYSKLEKVIADYVASSKIVKWTAGNLSKFDDFLQEHPIISRFAGVAISALLIYIWLNMSFTPDLAYSMDFDDIVNAALGKFSLADLFAGPEGVKLLTYFATGALLGLSFPWPSPTSVQFVGGLLLSITKTLKIKYKARIA